MRSIQAGLALNNSNIKIELKDFRSRLMGTVKTKLQKTRAKSASQINKEDILINCYFSKAFEKWVWFQYQKYLVLRLIIVFKNHI